MHIKGELTYDNLVSLQKDFLNTSDKAKKRINILTITSAGIVFVLLFLIQPSFHPVQIAINLVLTFLFALLVPVIIRHNAVRGLKRDVHSKKLGPFSLHLTEEGIDVQREYSSKHVAWKEIQRVTADDANFFLYHVNQSAIIIPRNAVKSDTELIELLSTYVGESKIETKTGASYNRKPKRAVFSVLIIALVLLVGVHYYYIKPQNDVARAVQMVDDLFVEVDGKSDSEKNDETPGKIKESTDQEQIDQTRKAIAKIDPDNGEHGGYSIAVLGLSLTVNDAQKQLDKREGNQISDGTNKDSSTESKDDPLEEQDKEDTLIEFTPNEKDVILKDNVLKNKDILEDFMKVAGENNESQIRVVKYVKSQGVIIYELKSRYDANADEGWISVDPDLSHYKPTENEVQDVFNNAPQQCGYMSKDKIEGYYKLNKCRTNWEYRLLPIPK
ncbi:hypothetical protein CFK37_18625 [Virgibacillus phasianinus]|uniref:YcxB-like C-terminal domain-containing protein n=1 Tax=Virgibacillus phasianinus TaxID=2017483 RepID=A0A220U7L3_9BACI|nr:YcxB family protein [Virgibacillus phasianinus]ASK64025.1 hypothetical protein CFK37_18625 [Virgibacillus phasianinus]